MVHGFSCSGMQETQYCNMCHAAKIGFMEEQYVSTGTNRVIHNELLDQHKKTLHRIFLLWTTLTKLTKLLSFIELCMIKVFPLDLLTRFKLFLHSLFS